MRDGVGEGGVNQLTVSGNRVINARMTSSKHIISVKEDGNDGNDDEDKDEDKEVAVADVTSSITNDFHSFCRLSNLHSSDWARGPSRDTTVEGF